MTKLESSPVLKFALRLDAVISGLSGAILLAIPALLATRFALPEMLLIVVGLISLPYALWLRHLAAQREITSVIVVFIFIGNALWADAALLLALGVGATPTALGVVYLATHVIATGSFAVLQFVGWRRSQVRGSMDAITCAP